MSEDLLDTVRKGDDRKVRKFVSKEKCEENNFLALRIATTFYRIKGEMDLYKEQNKYYKCIRILLPHVSEKIIEKLDLRVLLLDFETYDEIEASSSCVVM